MVLDLSPYGPAWYSKASYEDGYDGLDPSYLKKLSGTLEGGAAGAARTRRRRKRQSSSLTGEAAHLLRALKVCLNQGGNPQVQQLAQVLSSALLTKATKEPGQKDAKPKGVKRQPKTTKTLQVWKGHNYEVDPTTGWWSWVGPAQTEAASTPAVASRQVATKNQAQAVPEAPASEGLPRSYHKITFLRTLDWDPTVAPKLVSLSKLEQDLKQGDDPSGNLVEIWDPDHLDDLRCLWNAFGDPGPLTILGTCDLSHQGGFATRVSLSRGRFGSKLEPVWLKKVGAKQGPWVFTPTKVQKHQLPQNDKIQIRIAAPSHFRDQFLPDDTTHDSPTCVITQLATMHALRACDLLGGHWTNQTQGKVQKLVGYLRVHQEIALRLTKGSGGRAIFVTKVGDRSGPAAFWHRKEPKEHDSTYFRRLSAIAAARHEPLLWRSGGGQELGLARTAEDTYGTNKRGLSIQGIPRGWDPGDISSFFLQQGWTNLEVSHRNRNVWVAHGTPPEAQQKQAHWSFLVQDDVPWHINVQAWAARTKANVAVQVKGPSLKRPYGARGDGPQDGPKGPPDITTTAPAPRGRSEARQRSNRPANNDRSRSPKGDGEDTTTGSLERKTKLPRTQIDESTQEDVTMTQGDATAAVGVPCIIDAADAIKAGWSDVDLGGTGDCFFRAAAAAQMWNSKAQLLTPEEARSKGAWLRSLTVRHLKKDKKRFSQVWAPPESGPLAGLEYDAWLDEAAKQATFANGLIIQAFTELSGCPVIVWHDKTQTKQKVWDRVTLAGRFSKEGLACSSKEGSPLVLILRDKHYTMLQQPQDGRLPRSWLKDTGTSVIDADLDGAGPSTTGDSVVPPSLFSPSPSSAVPPTLFSPRASSGSVRQHRKQTSTGVACSRPSVPSPGLPNAPGPETKREDDRQRATPWERPTFRKGRPPTKVKIRLWGKQTDPRKRPKWNPRMPWEWVCPIHTCRFVIKGTYSGVASARYLHTRSKHPQVDSAMFRSEPPAMPVATTPDLPRGNNEAGAAPYAHTVSLSSASSSSDEP